MSRMNELLKIASESYENGIIVLSHGWIKEHNVTFDECVMLSSKLSDIINDHLRDRKLSKEILTQYNKLRNWSYVEEDKT